MQNTLPEEIGRRLRTYRLLLNMTQEELAERAGLHHTYIGQVERGEKNLTITSLGKITYYLQISLSDLFKDIEEFEAAQDDVALKCYRIIRDKDPQKQLHYYNILLEMEKIH